MDHHPSIIRIIPYNHSFLAPAVLLLTLQFLLLPCCHAGTEAPARFFAHQLVDHLAQPSHTTNNDNNNDNNNISDDDNIHRQRRWTQRYYVWEDYFAGPGSPIFVILGGEGAIEPSTGLLYPFVTHVLAKNLGAYVVQPEHRFYGASQPVSRDELDQAWAAGRADPRIQLLTSEQALQDALRLLTAIRDKIGCAAADQKNASTYCPVITVGGSYPGFLSAMARLVFPQQVDMAYAASAPMKFYSQTVSQNAYYNHITAVADKAYPGCAAAVKTALLDVQSYFLNTNQTNTTNATNDFQSQAVEIGICPGTIPSYVQTAEQFLDEVFMMVGYTFANFNMAYYPPSDQTRLYKACQTFAAHHQNQDIENNGHHHHRWTGLEKLKYFIVNSLSGRFNDCTDMRTQLPAGRGATISSGDWSGVGTGASGESWDWQTCTLLVEAIGFGPDSMFPPRAWSLHWLHEHCLQRFGVTPQPWKLVQQWNWDRLADVGASRILFTNGDNDGWSVSGISQNLTDDLVVINFPNGAHHSDLSGRGPSKDDTEDIRQGFVAIERILKTWIESVRHQHQHHHDNKGGATVPSSSHTMLLRHNHDATQ